MRYWLIGFIACWGFGLKLPEPWSQTVLLLGAGCLFRAVFIAVKEDNDLDEGI